MAGENIKTVDEVQEEDRRTDHDSPSEKVMETTNGQDLMGTVQMSEDAAEAELHGQHKFLVPRPSSDPNDPLNWTRKAKMTSLLCISTFAFLANLNSICFMPALPIIHAQFGVPLTTTSFLISLNVLMLGVGNLFWVPFMRKFGKRTMFIVACSIVVITNICSPFATSFGGLLAVRLISNFCAGSADATVPAFVGEVFFLHERGACMMIFHIFLSAAFFLGPVIAGWITTAGGWRWTVGFMGFATFANLIAMVFTLRESAYQRDYNVGTIEKRTYRQWLGFSIGYRPDVNPLRVFYEIIRLTIYPPILWAGFLIGIISASNVIQDVVTPTTLSLPPYRFSAGQIGSFQAPGFIGSVFGFFLGGKLIDYIAAVSTKRNHGIREPEMRLPALLIPAFFGPASVIVVGVCYHFLTHWMGPAVGVGLIGITITCTNNIGVTYAVDSYLAISGEVVTVVFVIRNTISCLVALYSTAWVSNIGVAQAFGVVAGLEMFIFLVGILFYLYGKQIRRFTLSYGPLKELQRRH